MEDKPNPYQDGLHLANNPLINPPPEIIHQGKDALRAYYAGLSKSRRLNEVKVILIGDGGAGKPLW